MKKRAAFISDPFGFSRKSRSGQLACPKEEVDLYLHNMLRDAEREKDLGECDILTRPPAPDIELNCSEPSWKEVQEILKAARASSAPGPSGVPYKVSKWCPNLLRQLWKILQVIWRKGRVAQQWRHAEGVWIPKEENARNIEQFRTISLLSVEGKVFFSVVARRLTEYLLKNQARGTRTERRPGCAMAGLGQRVWLHTPQAGCNCPRTVPCPSKDQGHHP